MQATAEVFRSHVPWSDTVPSQPPGDVTQLLIAWGAGDREALDGLMPLVYDELRRLAGSYLRRERPDHTLQPTALVNEAYLRLIDQRHARLQNRAHFFAIVAKLMRRVLVDHARKYRAAKRGGGQHKVVLDEGIEATGQPDVDVVAVHEALERLAAIDLREAKIVELRYFGGFGTNETAEVCGISPATVRREWRTAKAWLRRELGRSQPPTTR